ncbi:MAG: prepilin peptidase [Clostridioides sp.]|jgi:hypothetical protein|nr:prepilin peptidase [Clostridioides sp.]
MIKYLILIAILIQISIVDFYTGYVYDIIVVIGLITRSIFLCIEWSLFGVLDLRFILDLLVIIIVTYLLAVFTKSLGMGDVGLYGLCAFNLGIEFGIYIIILSFLIAFFYIITLFFAKYILYRIKLLKENIFLNDVGFKGKKISSDVVFKGKSIPFTPFISIATVIVIFTEYKLLIWYFNFIEIFLS